MVFHNLWKEKMVIFEWKSKKVRKYKEFFKCIVENHVESVDKKTDIFPHKSVEKQNHGSISLFGELWKSLIGILIIFSERNRHGF